MHAKFNQFRIGAAEAPKAVHIRKKLVRFRVESISKAMQIQPISSQIKS